MTRDEMIESLRATFEAQSSGETGNWTCGADRNRLRIDGTFDLGIIADQLLALVEIGGPTPLNLGEMLQEMVERTRTIAKFGPVRLDSTFVLNGQHYVISLKPIDEALAENPALAAKSLHEGGEQ